MLNLNLFTGVSKNFLNKNVIRRENIEKTVDIW